MALYLNNMNNNPWMGLLQQSMGMLGVNTGCFNSLGSYGTMGMNSSVFNFNTNYDAMAGFAVANSVVQCAGQIISSCRAEKQAEKQSYANDVNSINNIEKQIANLKDKKSSENIEKEIDSKFQTNIDSAIKNKASLTTKLDTLNGTGKGSIKELEEKLNAATNDTDKSVLQAEINKLKEEKSKLEQIEIPAAETKINEAKQAKTDAIKAKQAEIDEKIDELKQEKAKLQASVDSYENSKTKIKSKTPDAEYNLKLNGKDINNPKADDSTTYTKDDVHTAMSNFMKAVDGSPEKLQAAKELYYVHQHCDDFDKTTKRYAEKAFNYINEH